MGTRILDHADCETTLLTEQCHPKVNSLSYKICSLPKLVQCMKSDFILNYRMVSFEHHLFNVYLAFAD